MEEIFTIYKTLLCKSMHGTLPEYELLLYEQICRTLQAHYKNLELCYRTVNEEKEKVLEKEE